MGQFRPQSTLIAAIRTIAERGTGRAGSEVAAATVAFPVAVARRLRSFVSIDLGYGGLRRPLGFRRSKPFLDHRLLELARSGRAGIGHGPIRRHRAILS